MASASATLEAPATDKRGIPPGPSTPPKTRRGVEPGRLDETADDRAVGATAATAISPAEHLDAIGPEGRLDAYRSGALSRRERTIWAGRYPEEVPILNGEVEWIALSRADLD